MNETPQILLSTPKMFNGYVPARGFDLFRELFKSWRYKSASDYYKLRYGINISSLAYEFCLTLETIKTT